MVARENARGCGGSDDARRPPRPRRAETRRRRFRGAQRCRAYPSTAGRSPWPARKARAPGFRISRESSSHRPSIRADSSRRPRFRRSLSTQLVSSRRRHRTMDAHCPTPIIHHGTLAFVSRRVASRSVPRRPPSGPRLRPSRPRRRDVVVVARPPRVAMAALASPARVVGARARGVFDVPASGARGGRARLRPTTPFASAGPSGASAGGAPPDAPEASGSDAPAEGWRRRGDAERERRRGLPLRRHGAGSVEYVAAFARDPALRGAGPRLIGVAVARDVAGFRKCRRQGQHPDGPVRRRDRGRYGRPGPRRVRLRLRRRERRRPEQLRGPAQYARGAVADALEAALGIGFVRHASKKPASGAAALVDRFGCATDEMVMIGDLASARRTSHGNGTACSRCEAPPFTARGRRRIVRWRADVLIEARASARWRRKPPRATGGGRAVPGVLEAAREGAEPGKTPTRSCWTRGCGDARMCSKQPSMRSKPSTAYVWRRGDSPGRGGGTRRRRRPSRRDGKKTNAPVDSPSVLSSRPPSHLLRDQSRTASNGDLGAGLPTESSRSRPSSPSKWGTFLSPSPPSPNPSSAASARSDSNGSGIRGPGVGIPAKRRPRTNSRAGGARRAAVRGVRKPRGASRRRPASVRATRGGPARVRPPPRSGRRRRRRRRRPSAARPRRRSRRWLLAARPGPSARAAARCSASCRRASWSWCATSTRARGERGVAPNPPRPPRGA